MAKKRKKAALVIGNASVKAFVFGDNDWWGWAGRLHGQIDRVTVDYKSHPSALRAAHRWAEKHGIKVEVGK